MIKAEAEWDLPISQVLGNRFGNKFARVGFITLRSLADQIEKNGIRYWGGGEFFIADAPHIRMAGPKTWNAALTTLATLGFDWKDFIWTNDRFAKPANKPLAQILKEVSLSVNEVQESLKEILRRVEVSQHEGELK